MKEDEIRTIKVKFHASTNLVGSEISEVVNIEVHTDSDEKEINDLIHDEFIGWVWENINAGWKIQED